MYRGTRRAGPARLLPVLRQPGPWIRGIRLRDGQRALQFVKRAGVPSGVTSFGEDARGNVYVVTYNGIYRIVR